MLGCLNHKVGLAAVLLFASLTTAANAADRTVESVAVLPDAKATSTFGVGYLRAEANEGESFEIVPDRPWAKLEEPKQRVLYPVFLLSDGENSYWSRADRLHKARIIEAYFLFQGEQPLKVNWKLPDGKTIERTLKPSINSNRCEELQDEWWEHYKYAAKSRSESAAYPPQVENYLVSMLAKRLGKRPPSIVNPWSGRDDVDQAFGLLLGAESIRVAMQRDTVLKNTSREQTPNNPLPKPALPPAIELPDFDKDNVKIEAIAKHVPEECFYVRFGSFPNFQWLRTSLVKFGGMGRDLTALRGWNYGITDRLETQLALKDTWLAKLFGESLISDVAVIGADPFVRAGASIGVIFEARNSALLTLQLNRLRKEMQEANPGSKFSTVKIGQQDVSLLSTTDNKVRAFYVVDGDYHLITTSKTIAERFLAAGKNDKSLADLAEFQYARHIMPTSRDDACFVYLSDVFFRQLVSPKYRVEMTRRTQAVAEIELVHLARLAAQAEGAKHETVEQLIAGKFLPENFATRPDGSRTQIVDGQVVDSKRGARGAFLPVADVDIDELTDSELRAYQNFARFYRSQWERMDPAILGIQRKPAEKGREKLAIDVHITPYARRHYDSLARNLGKPSPWQLIPRKEDLAQATLNFGDRAGFLRGQFGFAGIRDLTDESMHFEIRHGQLIENLTPPIYYGMRNGTDLESKAETAKTGDTHAIGKSGLLFFYPFDTPDQANIREGLELKRQQQTSQLNVWVNRLAGTNLAKLINAHGYLRARRASAGNARFLSGLTEQLHIKPELALEVAENVLGAKFVCRMGGEYELKTDDKGFSCWQSSAWVHPSYHQIDEIPESFVSPMLKGFYEAGLQFSLDQTTLKSHLDIEIAEPKK